MQVNRDIFDAIRDGKKKVETRAASVKHLGIKAGDSLKMVCGDDFFVKKALKVQLFKTIDDMLKRYEVRQINPNMGTRGELEELYFSFPGYKVKIASMGLIAIELE